MLTMQEEVLQNWATISLEAEFFVAAFCSVLYAIFRHKWFQKTFERFCNYCTLFWFCFFGCFFTDAIAYELIVEPITTFAMATMLYSYQKFMAE